MTGGSLTPQQNAGSEMFAKDYPGIGLEVATWSVSIAIEMATTALDISREPPLQAAP